MWLKGTDGGTTINKKSMHPTCPDPVKDRRLRPIARLHTEDFMVVLVLSQPASLWSRYASNTPLVTWHVLHTPPLIPWVPYLFFDFFPRLFSGDASHFPPKTS